MTNTLKFCSYENDAPTELHGYMTRLYGTGEEQPKLDGEVSLVRSDHVFWNGMKDEFLKFVQGLPDDHTRYKVIIKESR